MALVAGGCQCGTIRYEVDWAQVLTLYCCHCLECQRQSASAFGMSALVSRSALKITKGELAQWERNTDRGGRNRAHFCPDCGVRIFHMADGEGEIASLKAGTLDDRTGLDPVGHIWLNRAQTWFRPSKTALIYQGQPDTYDSLVQAFRTRAAD